MPKTKVRAMSRLATADTLTRALIAKPMEEATVEIRMSVRRKMKNFSTSASNPISVKMERNYSMDTYEGVEHIAHACISTVYVQYVHYKLTAI